MIYKNWIVTKNEFRYFEAKRVDNSNENYLYNKFLNFLLTEIDEL